MFKKHLHNVRPNQTSFSVLFLYIRQIYRHKIRYMSLSGPSITLNKPNTLLLYGPRQANLLLIAYASSEGSGEPAHPRSLARTSAARSYKQWVKRNLQTESQIPAPSEWLGMRSWNLSWRNARRHKFAWRGPYINVMQMQFSVDTWPRKHMTAVRFKQWCVSSINFFTQIK